MGYYADDDDLGLVAILSDFSTKETAIISILLLFLVLILVVYSADSCGTSCAPMEGRVLEHQCYCVQADGTLLAHD